MSYKTTEAVKYRTDFAKYVEDEVKRQNWNLEINPLQHFYVDTWFYFPRVDMDASNYFKVMLDAITDTQLIWKDDNVVCERVQGINYDTKNPRVEILIRPVEYIGVFKDASHLEEFTSKCIGCARYARNCSILRQAKDGYIQPEIVDGVCLKYREPKNKKKE